MADKEKDKKDMAKRSESMPARVSGKGGKMAGAEGIDVKEDIIMPRVAVLQGLSEMVTEGKGVMGDLADSLSKENLGKELIFIPLFLFKTRVMFEAGEGLVMMSRDNVTISQASDKYQDRIGKACDDLEESQWQGKEAPKLSKVFNFPSLNLSKIKEFPISVSFLRTGMKAGRTLASLIVRGGEDIFARKYKLTTSIEKNDKGTFAVPHVELAGRCTDEEYAIAKDWYQKLRLKSIDVDIEAEGPKFEE